MPGAAPDTLIVGLKEIPEEDFALKNDHLSFAHCYKRQGAGPEQIPPRRDWTSSRPGVQSKRFIKNENSSAQESGDE
ncbi:unnamed protein product [Clonostachys byssicola]|uniref:Uncharacterized protein n=1 Tax=Clonostachys byssicola TaxID=160290 RepID=A0A9N9UQ58_9HYPO|nr:unnamed protein product [Clonostachys byssicola]